MEENRQKTIFGQEGGMLFVNSAQGTPGPWEAITDVYGRVPLAWMVGEAERITNESLTVDDTIFGRVAIRRYMQQSTALTGRRYTDARCRQLITEMDFLERVNGIDWTCVTSLNGFLREHALKVQATRRSALERAIAARIELPPERP